MINVVAGLIVNSSNKVLLARRSTGDENVLGKWEFPGGKVEENEEESTAIEREIKEEFNIDVKTVKYITNNIYNYPNKTVNLKLYLCKHISGDICLHDHFEYKWVDIKDLTNYDLAPADIALAEYIKLNENIIFGCYLWD